jgi:hypothetical protein
MCNKRKTEDIEQGIIEVNEKQYLMQSHDLNSAPKTQVNVCLAAHSVRSKSCISPVVFHPQLLVMVS